MNQTILFSLVFTFLLLIRASAQHEFYGTGAYTYPNSISSGGQLVKIDSLGRSFFDPNNPYSMSTYSVHDFDSIGGGNPLNGVIQATNGKLYGTTYYGGSNYNRGVLYEYDPVLDSFTVKKSLDYPSAYRLIQASDGMLYFTIGGAACYLCRYDINADSLANIHYFSYPETPLAGLTEVNGRLYGVTQLAGGVGYNGRIYEYNLSTQVFTNVHSFNCSTEGCQPLGALVHGPNGLLYGTLYTQVGNSSHDGSLYSFNPSTYAVSHLVNIPDTISYARFLTVGSNNKIYGSGNRGTDIYGTHSGCLFEFDPANNSIRLTHNFGFQPGGLFTGTVPLGGLLQASNGKMYGTTTYGSYEYNYFTDSVKLRSAAAGQTTNTNGILCEICRKPSYHYFPSDTAHLIVNDSFNLTISSDNAVNYTWLKDGIAQSSQTDSTLHFSNVTTGDSGTYSCIMSNWCGTTVVTGTIRIEVSASPTGFATDRKQNNITLSPNPADNLLNIGFSTGTGNTAIQVFDALGKLQLQKTVGGNIKGIQLDISSLPEGIYFIKVPTGNSACNLKFIVSR